jgi:PAS domain-containing protein
MHELVFRTQRSKTRMTDEQILLLRALSAAIIVTDLAGTVTYWNPFCRRTLRMVSERSCRT